MWRGDGTGEEKLKALPRITRPRRARGSEDPPEEAWTKLTEGTVGESGEGQAVETEWSRGGIGAGDVPVNGQEEDGPRVGRSARSNELAMLVSDLLLHIPAPVYRATHVQEHHVYVQPLLCVFLRSLKAAAAQLLEFNHLGVRSASREGCGRRVHSRRAPF